MDTNEQEYLVFNNLRVLFDLRDLKAFECFLRNKNMKRGNTKEEKELEPENKEQKLL